MYNEIIYPTVALHADLNPPCWLFFFETDRCRRCRFKAVNTDPFAFNDFNLRGYVYVKHLYVLKLSSGPSPEPPPEPSISLVMTGSLKAIWSPPSPPPVSVVSRRSRRKVATAGAFTSGARRLVLPCCWFCRAQTMSSSSDVSNSWSKLRRGCTATVICNIDITQSPSNATRMLGLHGP